MRMGIVLGLCIFLFSVDLVFSQQDTCLGTQDSPCSDWSHFDYTSGEILAVPPEELDWDAVLSSGRGGELSIDQQQAYTDQIRAGTITLDAATMRQFDSFKFALAMSRSYGTTFSFTEVFGNKDFTMSIEGNTLVSTFGNGGTLPLDTLPRGSIVQILATGEIVLIGHPNPPLEGDYKIYNRATQFPLTFADGRTLTLQGTIDVVGGQLYLTSGRAFAQVGDTVYDILQLSSEESERTRIRLAFSQEDTCDTSTNCAKVTVAGVHLTSNDHGAVGVIPNGEPLMREGFAPTGFVVGGGDSLGIAFRENLPPLVAHINGENPESYTHIQNGKMLIIRNGEFDWDTNTPVGTPLPLITTMDGYPPLDFSSLANPEALAQAYLAEMQEAGLDQRGARNVERLEEAKSDPRKYYEILAQIEREREIPDLLERVDGDHRRALVDYIALRGYDGNIEHLHRELIREEGIRSDTLKLVGKGTLFVASLFAPGSTGLLISGGGFVGQSLVEGGGNPIAGAQSIFEGYVDVAEGLFFEQELRLAPIIGENLARALEESEDVTDFASRRTGKPVEEITPQIINAVLEEAGEELGEGARQQIYGSIISPDGSCGLSYFKHTQMVSECRRERDREGFTRYESCETRFSSVPCTPQSGSLT